MPPYPSNIIRGCSAPCADFPAMIRPRHLDFKPAGWMQLMSSWSLLDVTPYVVGIQQTGMYTNVYMEHCCKRML